MKRVLVIIALLLATTVIWGAALPAAAQDAGEVTLTMWTHDGLYVQFFNARAEEWQERYPDIDFTFEFEVVPSVFDRVVTVFVLFFCSLAGFAFAKYTFRAKNVLFIILIGSTMIPFQLILIPLFILMSRIDWINHPASMIVPWMAPAFGIFLMRQYIQAVPTELMESARIDGASEFRIYAQIIVPLVRPGLTTLAILTFLGSWNSYIWPLMVLRGNKVVTLPVGIATMRSQATAAQTPYGEMMAAATMVSVPIILLFLMLQRYFISGLTIGAVKG